MTVALNPLLFFLMTSVSFMLRLHKNPKNNTIAKKMFNSPHVAISTH